MWRTAKKTGLLITSAAAGLATLSQCNAGLFSDLFDKERDKDRQEIEKRLPACDCEFGYFPTAWQPWGTCDQTSRAGCSNGNCRNSTPTPIPNFHPGYSSGPSSSTPQPYPETWTSPGTDVSPARPDAIDGSPSLQDHEPPSPILMTPPSEPAATTPALPSATPQPPVSSEPSPVAQPSSANPFPRAIKANPELPDLNASPYSNPGLSPVPNTPLPNVPQPQLGSGASVPLDPPQQPSAGIPAPATTSQPALTQPAPNYGSQGTGISLPPRRTTNVTIDIPPGSAGTTLTLPDLSRSGSTFGGDAGSPFPGDETPKGDPGDLGAPLKPLTPEPSLRQQPPVPTSSVIPGPAAAYQFPTRHPAPQQFVPRPAAPRYSAVQQAGAPQVIRQYPAAATQQFQQLVPQQFQPATHWQAVPQQQVQQRNWRAIPGGYPQQPVKQQIPPVQQMRQLQPQRRIPTPSERVILLPPPPRR